MELRKGFLFLVFCNALEILAASQPLEATSAIRADSTAIRKVITLIEEMKVQVEKEASQDEVSYNKYKCWCETNEKAKTAAIAEAERRISELTTFIEEMAANEARLKTEIQGLKQDIAEDQDALATATAIRQRELAAFLAEEEDLKETLGLLGEAVSVLSKVQLLQKQGSASAHAESQARSVLLQFKEKVLQRHPKFQSVMQRDLFDMLGSLEGFPGRRASSDEGFLPRKSAALVEKRSLPETEVTETNLPGLPWYKSDEQIGRESKSTDLTGAAANAKSYNSRSGRILGLLKEMGDETARDLAEAQKNDFRSEVSFQHLRAAKLDEISVATKQKKRKQAELAETLSKAAKAKEDREATTAALEADQEFLANMLQGCKEEAEQYKQRVAVRSDELVALSETLRILNEDDARDFFGKTVSFVQVQTSQSGGAQERVADRAMQKIAAVARKHKNWGRS